jgi:hypothetical protein
MEELINVNNNTISKRDYFAAEAMKVFLSNQARHRRMTPLSRLKWWLGGKGRCSDWKADYDINISNLVDYSYQVADEMMRKTNNL